MLKNTAWKKTAWKKSAWKKTLFSAGRGPSSQGLLTCLVPNLKPVVIGVGLAGLATFSAQAATLEGQVQVQMKSADSVPGVSQKLEFTRLYLEPVSGKGNRIEVKILPSGKFKADNVPPGSYRLRLIHPVYPVVEQTVEVQETANPPLSLTIAPSIIPPASVIEVEARATEGETPAAFTSLTREMLAERAQIRDVPALLSETPSVTWYSENGNGVGYNYLSLRGFDQRRISVMIDGVPQNDPEDHSVYWINVFDMTDVLEDIQVQRGGGAAVYGPPSIGGSVNMITRPLSVSPSAKVSLGYGVPFSVIPEAPADALISEHVRCGGYSTQKLSGEVNSGLLADKVVLFGRLSQVCSAGYREWSWSDFWRGMVGASYNGDRQNLTIKAYGGPQSDALAYSGIPRDYNSDPLLRRSNYGAPAEGRTGDVEAFGQYHVDVIHNYVFNPHVSMSNTLFYVGSQGYFDFDGSWGDPYYFRIDESQFPNFYLDTSDPNYVGISADTMLRAFVQNRQVGWLPRLTVDHGGPLESTGRLNLGLETRFHRSLHWGRIQQGTYDPTFQAAYVGEEADRHYYEYKGGKDVVSPYAHERLTRDRATVDANLQVVAQQYRFYDEAFEGNEFTVPYLFVNPRLGLHYRLNEDRDFPLAAFASVGQTTREPRLKELYDAENASYGVEPALDAVKPETMTDLEAGLSIQRLVWRASANAFLMNFDNEIVKTGGLDQYGQPYYGNAELTRHMGVELEAVAGLLPGLDLTGNLAYSQNRFIRFTEYLDDGSSAVRDGNPIAGFPDLLGNFRLSYRWNSLRLALDGHYVGTQYTDNAMDKDDEGLSTNGLKRVNPYFLAGAQLGWTPQKGWLKGFSASLDIQNLADARVLVAGEGEDNFFPNGPRSVFLQVQYEVGK